MVSRLGLAQGVSGFYPFRVSQPGAGRPAFSGQAIPAAQVASANTACLLDADKPFSGKRVLVAITGGIAAYKACDLIRLFQKQGASQVVAMMTPDAKKFVSPLTLESLTMSPVLVKNLENTLDGVPTHIAMAQQMDVMVVVPATANSLFKLSHGASDNVLTSTALTFTRKPLVICPAMNTRMWENPLTQENIARLKRLKNVTVVPPDSGLLACGETGEGKLPPVEHIALYAQRAIAPDNRHYQGKTVLLVGGPVGQNHTTPGWQLTTQDNTADVLALADTLFRQGADVRLVLGGRGAAVSRPYSVTMCADRESVFKTIERDKRLADAIVWTPPTAKPSARGATKSVDPALKKLLGLKWLVLPPGEKYNWADFQHVLDMTIASGRQRGALRPVFS